MSNTKIPTSLEDTKELRELIIKNPTLPIVVFVSEDANGGDYPYVFASDVSCKVEELAIYNDEIWYDYDDYREKLVDDLCDEEEYKNLSDDEYENMIDGKMEKVEFTKAIVLWVH